MSQFSFRETIELYQLGLIDKSTAQSRLGIAPEVIPIPESQSGRMSAFETIAAKERFLHCLAECGVAPVTRLSASSARRADLA